LSSNVEKFEEGKTDKKIKFPEKSPFLLFTNV